MLEIPCKFLVAQPPPEPSRVAEPKQEIKGIKGSGAGGGTRTLTHSRAADFESAASAISPLRQEKTNGAGEGNRTLVASLEGWSSAIELRPLWQMIGK